MIPTDNVVGEMKRNINKILGKLDLQLVRPSTQAPLRNLFDRLRLAGISTNVIWDVGAHQGNWTREVEGYCPNSRFILFEPNKVHNGFLVSVGHEFHNLLLGRHSGKIKFYSHGGTGDSTFPEYDENLKKRKAFRMERVFTIDELVQDASKFPKPDILKLDVQGAELEVLKGGEKTLIDTGVVLMECPLLHYNWGSPHIQDYLDFMFSRRFIPFLVTEIHRLNQITTQIDIAFIGESLFNNRILPIDTIGFWQSTKDRYLRKS